MFTPILGRHFRPLTTLTLVAAWVAMVLPASGQYAAGVAAAVAVAAAVTVTVADGAGAATRDPSAAVDHPSGYAGQRSAGNDEQ